MNSEPGILRIKRWHLGVSIGVITVLVSIGTLFLQHAVESTADQTNQTARIDNLEKRVQKLEEIAEKNTEGRIRLETKIEALDRNLQESHAVILQRLMVLETMLRDHEKKSRSRSE